MVALKKPKITKRVSAEELGLKSQNNGKAQYNTTLPVYSPRYKGAKLIVKFYKVNRGEKGDITSLEYLGESKTKYGAITVTWKEQEYKINYSLVFSDFKSFCYMSDALNAIGGIDFHDWGEVVNNTTGRINPSQAKEYHDSIVESALVGDRGIPRKWLYILIIGMAISGVIAGIMGLSYVGLSQKSGDEHTYLCQLEPTHKGCPPPPKAKDTSSSNIVKDTPSIQKGADK